jgi:hypothetical protein
MRPSLVPPQPLSKVVFVHDYLQLVFGSDVFTLYNRVQLKIGSALMVQGETGFCDELVRLISQKVLETHDRHALTMAFENGAELSVLNGETDVSGPEAFQYDGPDNLIIVEQNA